MLFGQLLLALFSSMLISGEDEEESSSSASHSTSEQIFPTSQASLKSSWSLWYDLQPKRGLQLEDYRKLLQKVGTFNSISGFWDTWHQLFESIPDQVCNFQVFKEGIEPIWEHERNINGGKWMITKGTTSRVEDNIKDWLSLVLSMIAGRLGFEDDICGAVLSIRNWGISITIWNKDSTNIEEINQISENLKTILGIDQVRYQPHQTSLKRNCTVVHKHASFQHLPRSNNNNNNHTGNRQSKKKVERALSAPAVLASNIINTGKATKQQPNPTPKKESDKPKKRRQKQRQKQQQKQQELSKDSVPLETPIPQTIDPSPIPPLQTGSNPDEDSHTRKRKNSKNKSPSKKQPQIQPARKQEPQQNDSQQPYDEEPVSRKFAHLLNAKVGISILIGATLTAMYIL